MFKSGSTKLVRNLNKQHILNLVRMNPGTTARYISKTTKLQMSTVLYTLRALKSEGFLREAGFGDTTVLGGKPPITWKLIPDYGYVLGIGVISREIKIVVLKFDSSILYKDSFPVKDAHNIDILVKQFIEIINKTVKKCKIPNEKILGLGVGFSGMVDGTKGVILKATGFHFENIPLKEILQEKFSFPVEVENNANAAVLGVKWLHSEAHTTPNILYLSIHKVFGAMGAGLVIDHKIYRGANYSAGEIGNFMRENRWLEILSETEKNNSDYKDLLNKKDATQNIPVSIPTVINESKKNNKAAIFIIEQVALDIAKEITDKVNLLDPDVVFIGGGIIEVKKIIEPIIARYVKENVVSDQSKNVPINYSPFGLYSVAMGGAALIFNKIFG